MYKLLAELKQEITPKLDERFSSIDEYYRLMGLELKPEPQIINAVRAHLNPSDEQLREGSSYQRDSSFENYIQPFLDKFWEIVEDVKVSRKSTFQKIIEDLKSHQEQIIEENVARREKKEQVILEQESRIAEVSEKIQEHEEEKARIKSPEIRKDVEVRLEKLMGEKESMEEHLATLKVPIESDEEDTHAYGESIGRLQEFAEKLSPFYDISKFNLDEIVKEEEKAYSFLKEILKDKIPAGYLKYRLETLKNSQTYSAPPEDWGSILKKIITNGSNVKQGIFFHWKETQDHYKSFSYLFGEEINPVYENINKYQNRIQNEISLFRLSTLHALDDVRKAIINNSYIYFKVADGIALRLRFRKLKKGKESGNSILLHIKGDEVKDQYNREPKWLKVSQLEESYYLFSGYIGSGYSSGSINSGYDLPIGFLLYDENFAIEVDFSCTPLLIGNNLSSRIQGVFDDSRKIMEEYYDDD